MVSFLSILELLLIGFQLFADKMGLKIDYNSFVILLMDSYFCLNPIVLNLVAMKKEKTTTNKPLVSKVSDLPKPYVRGALTTSDSTGGRGDGNDNSGNS